MSEKQGNAQQANKVFKNAEMDIQGNDSIRGSLHGRTAVDTKCPSNLHVYMEGNVKWSAELSKTKIKCNQNKCYLMKLLEDDSAGNFSLWLRWGRLGSPVQSNLIPYSDLETAKASFCKKFLRKTGNNWGDRDTFQLFDTKYGLVLTDDDVRYFATLMNTGGQSQITESKLNSTIQDFIKMIYDVNTMLETVTRMKYDANKCPLVDLTQEQINKGYKTLKDIEEMIVKKKASESTLEAACDKFYTLIPHNHGMTRPPLITTFDEISDKVHLLQALGNIQIAMRILNNPQERDIFENSTDRLYRHLNCDLELLDANSEEYETIQIYLENTHAPTHRHEYHQMKIINIFKCRKSAEEKEFIDYGNKMLLWHGSILANWVGVLERGIQLPDPNGPTGDMFGKGVYFADMSSKSANYCKPTKKNNEGVILLCEVSLGECNELLAANKRADQLPSGKHSVKGLGKMIPDPNQNIQLPDGNILPQGPGIMTNIKNKDGYTLRYNEYVVYNTRQIRMRYLVNIKFLYK